MATPTCAPSLSGLPSEILTSVIAWLGRREDLAALGATCLRMRVMCDDAAKRRMRANQLGARASMDAFVDEWQRIATDCDDLEVKRLMVKAVRECGVRHPRYSAGSTDNVDVDDEALISGKSAHCSSVGDRNHGTSDDINRDDNDRSRSGHHHRKGATVGNHVTAPDSDGSDPRNAQDNDDGGSQAPMDQIGESRIYRCVGSRAFDLASPVFDACTRAPDWSLHGKLPGGTRGFVCDACARGIAALLDDRDHTRWPMTRVYLDRPHVWADCCMGGPCSYVATPAISEWSVPRGMEAWIDADAAAHLARDIQRARRLLDAEHGASGKIDYYDYYAYNDNDIYNAEAVAKLGIVPRTVVQADLDYCDSDDGESDMRYSDSGDDDLVLKDDYDGGESNLERANSDDNDDDNKLNDGGSTDLVQRTGGWPAAHPVPAITIETACGAGSGAVDDGADGDDHRNGPPYMVALDDKRDAPYCDPFRYMSHSGRYSWWASGTPAALVRIYQVPASIMGNLRAWLPIGMVKDPCRQSHRGEIARYALVCCDPASPLWGGIVAVRSVTDRWPCISWLPAANNAMAALGTYCKSVHEPTTASLRDGFVRWLCTARRTPSPITWEGRREAAIARVQPTLPHWTGFPHFAG